MPENLHYIIQIITDSPILAYPDPDKKYYLFTDSSKHSCSKVLVQYHEQKQEDRITLSISHPITYQSGTFQGFQKNWNILTKEAYAIYLSFRKKGFLHERCTCQDPM